jgi:hypothetical protein
LDTAAGSDTKDTKVPAPDEKAIEELRSMSLATFLHPLVGDVGTLEAEGKAITVPITGGDSRNRPRYVVKFDGGRPRIYKNFGEAEKAIKAEKLIDTGMGTKGEGKKIITHDTGLLAAWEGSYLAGETAKSSKRVVIGKVVKGEAASMTVIRDNQVDAALKAGALKSTNYDTTVSPPHSATLGGPRLASLVKGRPSSILTRSASGTPLLPGQVLGSGRRGSAADIAGRRGSKDAS